MDTSDQPESSSGEASPEAPADRGLFSFIVSLCHIDRDRVDPGKLPPKKLSSRSRQIDRVLSNGIERINPATGKPEVIALSIANHDSPSTGFVYAKRRVVLRGTSEGLIRDQYPQLFAERPERLGETIVLTTASDEVDALAVVRQINARNNDRVASVDHVVWAGQSGHVICREADDPEPADRPDGPHRDDLERGRGIRIAVIDNGVAEEALTDSWLDGVAVGSADTDELRTFAASSPNPNSLDLSAGHGTFVTGVIRQVAPGAEIIVIKKLNSDGAGLESDLAAGIDRAVAEGAQIINLSVGEYTDGDLPPLALLDALSRVPKDVAVIAAAGNEATDRPLYPAALDGVLGVAALDLEGANEGDFPNATLASYSNVQPIGAAFYVAAAGRWTSVFVSGVENPLRDDPPDRFDGYALASGSSFSAAALSGMVAVGMARSGLSATDVVNKITAQAASANSTKATTGVDDNVLHVDVWSS